MIWLSFHPFPKAKITYTETACNSDTYTKRLTASCSSLIKCVYAPCRSRLLTRFLTQHFLFTFFLLLIANATQTAAASFASRKQAVSNSWLNVSELPHFVPTCSQSADATAAMFLLSNQQTFTLTCIRKIRTLRGLALPMLSGAIAESPLARIYSHA